MSSPAAAAVNDILRAAFASLAPVAVPAPAASDEHGDESSSSPTEDPLSSLERALSADAPQSPPPNPPPSYPPPEVPSSPSATHPEAEERPSSPSAPADSDMKTEFTYPPLPDVGIKLFNQVYTHKTLHGPRYILGQDYLRVPDDYERLAFVGAAVLQLCVAQMACEMHPNKVVGFLTQWRQSLICSDMLALWAQAYNMPAYLKTSPGLSELAAKPKTAAALLEAYIGALASHSGFAAASAFVRALVDAQLARQPELRDTIQLTPPTTPPAAQKSMGADDAAEAARAEQNNNPLALLNMRAAQTGRRIEWREEPQGPEHSKSWKMTVLIDGIVHGEGTAERKRNGKLIAAAQAWEALRAELDSGKR